MNTLATWNPDVKLRLSDEPSQMSPLLHQLEAWNRLVQHFVDQDKQAGLVVAPTGGGKTVIGGHFLLERHIRNGGRVLWLAHRRSLLRQAFGAFRWLRNVAYPNEDLRLIAVSSIDCRWSEVTAEHDVVFSSIQSAVLPENMDFVEIFVDDSEHGVFVVVDEAHHAPAPSYARLLRRLKDRGCKVLGLTATPVRNDEEEQKRLESLFDKSIVYEVKRKELIDANVLAAPSFVTVKTEVDVEKDFTPEDYKNIARFGEIPPAVLRRLAKNACRNKAIVEHYVDNKDKYGPTIVFAADAAHCVLLAEEFEKAGKKEGFTADYVTYDRTDSQAVISRYQDHKQPDVMINVEMLTEGFDAPHTRTVFIARPTRSEVLLTQMVGRALRGTTVNGNEIAYLVTFLDTWQQFNVLDAEYPFDHEEEEGGWGKGPKPPVGPTPPVPFAVPIELLRELYRLIEQVRIKGVFQCLPYGWFTWWEMFEDDEQARTVMIFENQREAFESMLADIADPASIPEDVTEDYARSLIGRYFADIPDPLPRWADVKALLDAKRKGCEIHRQTFEGKRRWDPKVLARQVFEQEMSPQTKRQFLQRIWDESADCRSVYRDNVQAFLEDYSREENRLLSPPQPTLEPEIERIVPDHPPKPWGEGESGYNLISLRDTVLSVKKHFPHGTPKLGDLRWMDRISKQYFGFCRYSDRCITINRALNSPEVPLFVMEFLVYHELLHADMPYAGHNPDFKARERLFQPSAEALEEAMRNGIKPATTTGAWRARAWGFLQTFQNRWIIGEPGSEVSL